VALKGVHEGHSIRQRHLQSGRVQEILRQNQDTRHLAIKAAERGQALVEPGGHVLSDLLESTVDEIIIVEQPLCCLARFRGRINTSKTSMAQPIGNRLNALDEN
jgi:riboflavin biosynthesis pyrimidine reductase